MADLILYIGNKNYSSWSFRPWIAMHEFGIPFVEKLVPFDFEAGNPAFAAFSPTNKVPVLKHGDITVWESLAILEYLADLFPDKSLWPASSGIRAHARAISAEMLGNFSALRSECPMNMRRQPSAIDISEAARRDIVRVEQIWRECLDAHGGPYLYGAFSAADAMYAPVVNRLDIYELVQDSRVRDYMAAIKALPAWRDWEQAGRDEPWIVEEDEI